jgi:hypothetical protein
VKQTREEHKRAVNEVLTRLSRDFGGCTAIKGQGSWLSDSHGLIVENVTICKSYFDIPQDEALSKAREIAAWLKALFEQEAISIETNEGLEFV